MVLIDQVGYIDSFFIHKKFYGYNLIYNKIINSIGYKLIDTRINLNKNFINNKNYTIFGF